MTRSTKGPAVRKTPAIATLSHGEKSQAWPAGCLRSALAKSGFAWKADGQMVEAGLLARGCEAFLDKETDGDVIALYEFAEAVRALHGADAGLVAARD